MYGVRAYRLVPHADHGLAADFRLHIGREPASRVDCADLARPKALSRKGIRHEVGTIARSAQSAITRGYGSASPLAPPGQTAAMRPVVWIRLSLGRHLWCVLTTGQ
jgi:hypothetical protein